MASKNVAETINDAVAKQILSATDLPALVLKHSDKITKMLDAAVEETIDHVAESFRDSLYDFDMYSITEQIEKFVTQELKARLNVAKPKAAKKSKKTRK